MGKLIHVDKKTAKAANKKLETLLKKEKTWVAEDKRMKKEVADEIKRRDAAHAASLKGGGK